jgi:hypothetical protein
MADFLSDAASQLAQPPGGGGGIKSLGDFADVTKLAPPTALAGLTTDLKGMASKLNDLGANFKNPEAAANMFNSIEIPNVPSFDSAYSSLGDMMSQHAETLGNLTVGTSGVPCTGPMGVPSVEDFMSAVTGGPEIDALTNGEITAESLASLTASLDRAEGLFAAAGIDLDAPPPAPSLGSLISAATSLQKIGAETNGSGAADALKKMIPNVAPGETDPAKIANGIFGDAIKTSMAEGKNLKAMAAAGIKPPQFNPFEGLPAGSDTNIASESAQRLLGG